MSRVLVNFIQDRSGSMQSLWDETLNGFKVFCDELRKDDATEYFISLTTFDTTVNRVTEAVPLKGFDPAILQDYGPRGATSLYDAVGLTVRNCKPQEHNIDKVICVISTDGYENASQEWNKDALHTLVDEKLNSGQWTFTYLGTQPETWGDAGAFGIAVGSTVRMNMARGDMGTRYRATAQTVNTFSSSPVRGTRTLFETYGDEAELTVAGLDVSSPDVSVPGGTSGDPEQPDQSDQDDVGNDSLRWK